jgi:hypothetical protein
MNTMNPINPMNLFKFTVRTVVFFGLTTGPAIFLFCPLTPTLSLEGRGGRRDSKKI